MKVKKVYNFDTRLTILTKCHHKKACYIRISNLTVITPCNKATLSPKILISLILDIQKKPALIKSLLSMNQWGWQRRLETLPVSTTSLP